MMPVLFPVSTAHKLPGRESVCTYGDWSYYPDEMLPAGFEIHHEEHSKEERARVVNAMDVEGEPNLVHGMDRNQKHERFVF